LTCKSSGSFVVCRLFYFLFLVDLKKKNDEDEEEIFDKDQLRKTKRKHER